MRTKKKSLLTALLCLCLCVGFCGLLPQRAAADGTIPKVLATTSYTPVALMDTGFISAATSTSGIYLVDYGWYDANTGVRLSTFGPGRTYVSMTFATIDGYTFAGNVTVYLNNAPASFTRSEDGRFLTLQRTYEPMIWAPSVVKNPADEYLDAGGYASFVASASYTEGFQWYAVDPESGEAVPVNEIPNVIDIISNGDGSSKMNIYDVPAWMDGWQVYCRFVGALGAHSNSARATLHVHYVEPPVQPEAPETPPEETPESTPEPTPEPSPEPAPEPTPEPSPEPVHVHEFPETWSKSETLHWRECSCGERVEQGAHTYEWSVERKASMKSPGVERGVCSVCGYETTRPLAYDPEHDVVRFAVTGVGGLIGLTLIVLAVDSLRHRHKK